MAKMQEQNEEERIVAKSKLAAMNLSSHVPANSSYAKKSDSIQKSGEIYSYGETWKQDEKKFEIRRSVEFSSAAARCIPCRVDGHRSGGNLSQQKRCQEMWTFPNLKPIAYAEAVFSIVRDIHGREHDDPMDDLDLNMAIWGIFLNATLRAAVHFGQDNEAKLRYMKNHLLEQCETVIQWIWKTDQWTNRDHWCTHDRVQRTYVDVHKLLVRSSLSVHQRQSPPLLRLCTLCRENGRWSTEFFFLTKDVKVPRRKLSANIQPNMRSHIQTKHIDLILTNIDHVPANGTHSGPRCYVVCSWGQWGRD